MQDLSEAFGFGRETPSDLAQTLDVDADTDVLHLGEHPHERILDVDVQMAHRLRIERRLEHGRQRCDSGGSGHRVLSRTGGRSIEIELAGRSADVGKTYVGAIEEQSPDRVVVRTRLEQIGRDGGIEFEAGQIDTDRQSGAHERLEVVTAHAMP